MQELLFDQDVDPSTEYLTESWLYGLYQDHRNVVQLAQPTPMLAASAEEVLDIVFERMVIDPVSHATSARPSTPYWPGSAPHISSRSCLL